MACMDYEAINSDISHKCEEVLIELSAVHNNLAECLKYFQGCIDDGIVPPENLENNIQFLYSFDSGIKELLEMLCDYRGNIDHSEVNRECIRNLIWLDKQIIARLEHSVYISDKMRDVLTDSIDVVSYWCAQKWLNGEISPGIKSKVEMILTRYCYLMPLLNHLMVSIEKHFYLYSELEKTITIACVYASPEIMGERHYEEVDKSEEKTYPYLYAIKDEPSNKKADNDKVLMMQELYGGPEMITGTPISSDTHNSKYDISGISDPDETVQFCRQCGRSFTMTLNACPYCGTIAREKQRQTREIDDSSMACVYASPEMMGFQIRKKSGLLKKIFGGKEGKKK